MNRTYFVLLALLLAAGSSNAENFDAGPFSIAIPERWVIEYDKSGVIYAAEIRGEKRSHLSIQYCLDEKKQTSLPNLVACPKPCGPESLDRQLSTARTKQGIEFSSISTHTTFAGLTEYSSEARAKERSPRVMAKLICAPRGQVYMTLVSDQPSAVVKELFTTISSSVTWK